jgi:mRNA interferase RelE/StbE
MVWAVEFSQAAVKTLDKLDRPVRARILRFFETRVTDDPRQVGKALVGGKGDPRAWGYRVGDWRMICHLDDTRRIVFVVKVGNRREIYD